MNVEIGTETPIFLFWEYLFRNFGILSLQRRSQSWLENTNMTECTQEIGFLESINSDEHLPQSPFQVHFLDNDILH